MLRIIGLITLGTWAGFLMNNAIISLPFKIAIGREQTWLNDLGIYTGPNESPWLNSSYDLTRSSRYITVLCLFYRIVSSYQMCG